MSRYTGLNTTFQERSDFEDTINALETRHRHDLSVHLYLTFLLHHVNPLFPASQWASWPQPPSTVLDPQMNTDAEDFVVADHIYDDTEDKFYFDASNNATGPRGVRLVQLDHHPELVPMHYKRQKLSSPKVTIVNEIHFLLQRRIRQHLSRTSAVKGAITLEDDSQLLQSTATRLANRMGKVLDMLADQPRKQHQTSDGEYITDKGTWQDVAIANLYYEKLNSLVDLESHKRLYLKMRKVFTNVHFPYEYDPEIYEDEATGTQEEVPEFDVVENLKAIEEQGLAPTGFGLALDHLKQREKNQDCKERIFLALMDQAVREKQLLHASAERERPKSLGIYEPRGGLFKERRKRVFKQSALQAKTFLSGYKKRT